MASKQVFFRSEARERILKGVTALADAVRVTLGPKGEHLLLLGAAGTVDAMSTLEKTIQAVYASVKAEAGK